MPRAQRPEREKSWSYEVVVANMSPIAGDQRVAGVIAHRGIFSVKSGLDWTLAVVDLVLPALQLEDIFWVVEIPPPSSSPFAGGKLVARPTLMAPLSPHNLTNFLLLSRPVVDVKITTHYPEVVPRDADEAFDIV